MNTSEARYFSRKSFLSSVVDKEKSRWRRFVFAIYVLYMYVQYVDVGRTHSPYLFSYKYSIHQIRAKVKFSSVKFEFLISWYFVARALPL